jgi:hypothetical protein
MKLDATGYEGEDDVVGGNSGRPAPGLYHACLNLCQEASAKSSGNPGISTEFLILHEGLTGYKLKTDAKGKVLGIEGGKPTEGQVGRTLQKFFSHQGKNEESTAFCLKCQTRFAMAVGAILPGEAKEPDWDSMTGRELVIEIVAKEYENKNGQKAMGSDLAALGFWSLGNKVVANVPKDTTTPGMQQLAKAGGPVNHPEAGGNGSGAKAVAAMQSTANAVAGAASTTRSKFADL